MLRKIMLASVAIGMSLSLLAQDSTKSAPSPVLSITGSADFYYKYDFSKTKANNLTSFTNTQNAFSLGMASVKVEHRSSKLDMVADLGFGQRAKEFSYNDEGVLSAIKQLYLSYSPNDWLKFTAGTWATHVGYELVDPQLNRNYSMSYMFTNGPFTHTGVKAEIAKGRNGFMLGVADATDFRAVPDGKINRKFLLAQYSLAITDNVKMFVNYVGGKNPDTSTTSQLDAVLTAKLNDLFSLGYNGTINTSHAWNGAKNLGGEHWSGHAVYVNIDPAPTYGFTLRTELFQDKKQLKMFATAPKGGDVLATTLSANFKTGGFIFIPELRIDHASEKIFLSKSGASASTATSFIVAAIYAF